MRPETALMIVVAVVAASPGKAGVPVRVGGDAVEDACGTAGQVTGLGPQGFLAVRGGPGTGYPTRDRIGGGRALNICEERGAWLGVVYGAKGADCAVATPRPKRVAYAGPCRSGWVHRRYVEVLAG